MTIAGLTTATRMFHIAAYQFTILPHPRQSTKECLGSMRRTATDWLRRSHEASGNPIAHLAFDGVVQHPHRDHDLCCDERFRDQYGLLTICWEFVDHRQPGTRWRLDCVAACDAKVVDLVVTLGTAATCRGPAGQKIEVLPGLLDASHALVCHWLEEWRCLVDGEEVPTTLLDLREPAQVEEFVRERLCSPKRALPILLVSLDRAEQATVDKFQLLQMRLLGLTRVVLVVPPARARLTELLGVIHGCSSAGVRVYWPGLVEPLQGYDTFSGKAIDRHFLPIFARAGAESFRESPLMRKVRSELMGDSKPVKNRRRLYEELERLRAANAKLVRERDAAAKTGHPLEGCPRSPALLSSESPSVSRDSLCLQQLTALENDLAAARNQSDQLRRELAASQSELASVKSQLTAKNEQLTAFAAVRDQGDGVYTELERAWDQNRRLWKEVQESRQRTTALEEELAAVKKEWSLCLVAHARLPGAPSRQEAATKLDFGDVLAALAAATNEFSDILLVWDDARSSAEESRFSSPAKVYQALQAIAEVGRDYFRSKHGGPALGPVAKAFRRRVPFKYTGFESRSTLGYFGEERIFHHGDQVLQMQRHLTLGGGQTNNCLQIYFEFDPATRRVLIGYCGRHLRFTRMRT